MIELLDRLHESGELQRLINSGFVSGTVAIWRNVYHHYETELETTGSKMQAMSNTADNCNLSLQTIRYIRDKFEKC